MICSLLTVICTFIGYIVWVLLCEKQTMMRCVEIVNSARERMARVNVPLDLIRSMFFLYFHDNCLMFQIQLVTSWWSITFTPIYSCHLHEKRTKFAMLVTCQPLCSASSSLSTFPPYAFQRTTEVLKMLRHSNSGDIVVEIGHYLVTIECHRSNECYERDFW
jgi:hypothetical protein